MTGTDEPGPERSGRHRPAGNGDVAVRSGVRPEQRRQLRRVPGDPDPRGGVDDHGPGPASVCGIEDRATDPVDGPGPCGVLDPRAVLARGRAVYLLQPGQLAGRHAVRSADGALVPGDAGHDRDDLPAEKVPGLGGGGVRGADPLRRGQSVPGLRPLRGVPETPGGALRLHGPLQPPGRVHIGRAHRGGRAPERRHVEQGVGVPRTQVRVPGEQPADGVGAHHPGCVGLRAQGVLRHRLQVVPGGRFRGGQRVGRPVVTGREVRPQRRGPVGVEEPGERRLHDGVVEQPGRVRPMGPQEIGDDGRSPPTDHDPRGGDGLAADQQG